MINEDYVSYEVAKLLKEKGFDEGCRLHYHYEKAFDKYFPTDESISGFEQYYYPCPTLQMTVKWLREVHNIHTEANLTFSENPEAHPARYYVYVLDTKSGNSLIEKSATISGLNPLADESGTPRNFNTYEEACEAAIKYCLENLI